jgi:predicted enzyme related to lactoylglutathione lyase
MTTSNTFCWIDIPVNDLDRSIKFYSALLGASVDKVAEHGFEFGLLPHSEENVSGCLSVMEDRKPSQDGPLVYLNVEGKLDEAIDAAQANGGTLLKAKEQIGPYGYRAIILDTEGNAVALYSSKSG